MRSAILILAAAFAVTGCAAQPYDPAPTSPIQWQRRQERIEREAARAAAAENNQAPAPRTGDQ